MSVRLRPLPFIPGTLLALAATAPMGVAPALSAAPVTTSEIAHSKLFEEPMVALGEPSPAENQALAQALQLFNDGGRLEAVEPLEAFLAAFPDGAWSLALRVNLGLLQRHVGRTAAALKAWEAAWEEGRGLQDPQGMALANRALGELLEVNASLGRPEALDVLIAQGQGRRLSGLVTEKLAAARESLAFMRATPYHAFQCGPVALSYLKALEGPYGLVEQPEIIHGGQGTNLAMNAALAQTLGLHLQMAKCEAGTPYPVPSVVHFRTGHFSALLYRSGGKSLLQDPSLGDAWVTDAVLAEEASGYALIPAGPLPNGWRAVAEDEGSTIWGRGAWGPGRPDDTRPDSRRIPSSLPPLGAGQPTLAYHANLASLNLTVPVVDYQPILGPRVNFNVTYNQREYGQPQVFDYCNLGSKWTFSFLACLKDDTTTPLGDVAMCYPGGGGLVFHAQDDGAFRVEGRTQARLERLPAGGYALTYPGGRKEFYELSDRAWGLRRTVLTRIQDKLGREVRLTWDPLLRLQAVTDAAGQTTRLSYDLAQDPLKITGVTDPFGRRTVFQYGPGGNLASVQDPLGRVAAFAYGPTPADPDLPQDALNTLAARGGTFHFRSGEVKTALGLNRWIETTRDGSGRTERIEAGAGYAPNNNALPRIPDLEEKYYLKLHPTALSYRETRFWSDAGQGGAPTEQIRWGHGPGGYSSGIVVGDQAKPGPLHVLVHAGDFWGGAFPAARSASYPLDPEGALQPGMAFGGLQGTPGTADHLVPVYDGDRDLVSRDYWSQDGALVRIARTFDGWGHLLEDQVETGAKGTWTWDPATGDLRTAQGPLDPRPATFTYEAQHRLKTWTPANGPAWTAGYDDQGRLASWTPAKGPAWKLHRDAQGLLDRITRGGRTWTVTFNERHQLATLATSKGLRWTFSYDAWDRPVRTIGRQKWEWRYLDDGTCERKVGQDWRTVVPGKAYFWGFGPSAVPETQGNPFQSVLEGADGPVLQALFFPVEGR